jgi:DNA-binding transcriptional MerR regulator
MSMLSIGQMAALNQVSSQTLRFYDKIGLLIPQYIDTQNNYRYYDITQCARLASIQYMKYIGLHLTQIKKQLDKEDIDLALKTLAEQSEEIQKQSIRLNEMKCEVDKCILNYDKYLKYVNLTDHLKVIREHVPKRKIFCTIPEITEESVSSFEHNFRKLKKLADLKQIKMLSLQNFGTIIQTRSIEKDNFVPSKTCLFINDQYKIEENIEEIPEGEFLFTYYDDYREEKNNRQLLLKYIKEHNHQIIGDYIFEIVADLPVFVRGERKLLIRSQIPIQ